MGGEDSDSGEVEGDGRGGFFFSITRPGFLFELARLFPFSKSGLAVRRFFSPRVAERELRQGCRDAFGRLGAGRGECVVVEPFD